MKKQNLMLNVLLMCSLTGCKSGSQSDEPTTVKLSGVEAMKQLCTWIKGNHALPASGDVDWTVYSISKEVPAATETQKFDYLAQVKGSCATNEENLNFQFASLEQVYKDSADHVRLSEDKITRSLDLTLSNDGSDSLLGGTRYAFDQALNKLPADGNNSVYSRKDESTSGFKSVLLDVRDGKQLNLTFTVRDASVTENAREDWNNGNTQITADNVLRKASYTGTLSLNLNGDRPLIYTPQPLQPEGLPFALATKLAFFNFAPTY